MQKIGIKYISISTPWVLNKIALKTMYGISQFDGDRIMFSCDAMLHNGYMALICFVLLQGYFGDSVYKNVINLKIRFKLF